MTMIYKGSITDTSPAAASTAVGDTIAGLNDFDSITCYASLVGATGGTLDVYLQTSWDGGTTWADICHFPQLAAGASAVKYAVSFCRGPATVPVVVGVGSVGTPGVALAANVATGWTFGPQIRAVYVAGASTSAGAAVLISVNGFRK
jgi:hypothetical protein